MAPKQTDPQFKLRMTPEIKDAIEKSASESNRSMNAEIIHRIELSYKYYDLLSEFRKLESELSSANKDLDIMEEDFQETARQRQKLMDALDSQSEMHRTYRNLLISICLHITSFGKDIPENLKRFAEETLRSLETSETRDKPLF